MGKPKGPGNKFRTRDLKTIGLGTRRRTFQVGKNATDELTGAALDTSLNERGWKEEKLAVVGRSTHLKFKAKSDVSMFKSIDN